jgi:triacylglycerol lipase
MALRIGSASKEIAAFARQAWLLRHDVTRPVLPAETQRGDHVVICLHGLFATAGVLRPLRKRLDRHAGLHTASMSFPVGPGIAALARRLTHVLAELPRDVHVHLLGHSLGGVVARHFAQEIGDPRLVQTISLAAPFAGVPHAGRLGVAVARDLDPSSALLRKLMLGSRRALALPHLSLVAEHDAVVTAPLSHALPGGDVTVIRNCGHNAMLFHDEVARRVEQRVLDHVGQPVSHAG